MCDAELFKMVCEANETDVHIDIPAIMLPQDAGANLENHIKSNSTGMFPLLCFEINHAVGHASDVLVERHPFALVSLLDKIDLALI